MKKISSAALFMYSAMALTALLSAGGFYLYYSKICALEIIFWVAIISFMILYHFGLRILFGFITKCFNIDYNHPWFRQRGFEKSLYRLLRVRRWKDKVLTFEPQYYDVKTRTLCQLATTMSKSELDHWINEIISLFSIAFALVWGHTAMFVLQALFAMIFDAQFIIVQRYNRPVVLKLMSLEKNRKNKKPSLLAAQGGTKK